MNTSGARLYDGLRVDDELAAVLLECALQLVGVGRHRARVVHDRAEPEHEERGGNDERAERQRTRADICPLPQRAHDEESDERDPEEDRVRRMHDREHESRSCSRRDEPERRQSARTRAPTRARPARGAGATTSRAGRGRRRRRPSPARTRSSPPARPRSRPPPTSAGRAPSRPRRRREPRAARGSTEGA